MARNAFVRCFRLCSEAQTLAEGTRRSVLWDLCAGLNLSSQYRCLAEPGALPAL